ncbi:MAG: hypothetical protein QM655_09640 [Nocardioidaceae bacterium]
MRKPFIAFVTMTLGATLLLAPSPAGAADSAGNGPLLVEGWTDNELRWVPSDVEGPTGAFGFDADGLFDVLDVSDDGSWMLYRSGFSVEGDQLRVHTGDGDDFSVGSVPGWTQAAAISPDKSRIAVVIEQYNDDNKLVRHLLTMPSTGLAEPTELINDLDDDSILWDTLDFDPVTGKVAFVRWARIGLIDPATGVISDFLGGCTWMAQEPTGDDCATANWPGLDGNAFDFSASGDRIAVQLADFDEDGSDPYFGTLSRAGSTVRLMDVPVDDAGSYTLGSAFFSPDGTKVAMERWQPLGDDESRPDVYVQSATGGTAVEVAHASRLRGWLACPGDVCPDYGSKVETTTVLKYLADMKKIKAYGEVSPPQTGSVTVTLQAKKKTWKTVQTKTLQLSGASTYSTTFSRPKFDFCRLKVRFNGNDEASASTSPTMLFSC